MNRLSYALGAAYIALCAVAVAAAGPPAVGMDHQAVAAPIRPGPLLTPERAPDGAAAWFQTVKPSCNALEVETALRQRPAPGGLDGVGYQAACLALAGKIDRARLALETLDGDQRRQAAGIVFDVAHPVADQGDDRSAGPIMAMVADYWPNHYMALYHAGMSEAALGAGPDARRHLETFLQLYRAEDGWRTAAGAALRRLDR
jgi:hypothetical protein